MAQRQRKRDPINTNVTPARTDSGVAFITFDPTKAGAAQAAQEAGNALQSYGAIASRTRFEDVHTNTSIRNEFNRGDYEAYRPSESIPHKPEDIMRASMRAYKKVSIVRNVVDLMSDFGSQGIKVVHPNPRIQRFAQRWFLRKVKGNLVSERILNYLYRNGNPVVQRTMARIPISEERRLTIAGEYTLPASDQFRMASAGSMALEYAQGQKPTKLKPDEEPAKSLQTLKRNIPVRYNFLNPLSIEIAGGELAQFVGKQIVSLKITGSLRSKINMPKTDEERELIKQIPIEIRTAIKNGKSTVKLDQDKIILLHYKKDDWETWASPMVEAILDDLVILEKMKLADLSALDGAISQIRIWKLGDLEKGILPTDAAIQKLADILLSNPGGGAFDLIWGPELTFQDATTTVHEFLGGEKYEPVLREIHSGLGVPPTLTGAPTAAGLTNNFVSMQTLLKRLEYGRTILNCFWEQELELLRQAMGWQKAPTISFDRMILVDEVAEKALIREMLDRDMISEETALERFGEDPQLEELRKRRERRERERGLRGPKYGPYFAQEQMHELIKIGLEKGFITTKQAGIKVEETEEVAPFDKQMKMIEQKNTQIGGGGGGGGSSKPTGKSGQGRPKNSKDSGTRKTRTPKVRTSAQWAQDLSYHLNAMIWARAAQQDISDIINPGVLHSFSKKNLRSLSATEALEAERVKFRVLSNIEPFSKITKELVASLVQPENKLPLAHSQCCKAFISNHVTNNGKEPTADEMKSIHAAVYSLCSEGDV